MHKMIPLQYRFSRARDIWSVGHTTNLLIRSCREKEVVPNCNEVETQFISQHRGFQESIKVICSMYWYMYPKIRFHPFHISANVHCPLLGFFVSFSRVSIDQFGIDIQARAISEAWTDSFLHSFVRVQSSIDGELVIDRVTELISLEKFHATGQIASIFHTSMDRSLASPPRAKSCTPKLSDRAG